MTDHVAKAGTAAALAALAGALGCTGEVSGPAPASVNVAPPATTISAGATAQFSASVAGTKQGAVAWTVSGAAKGNIASSGLYSAPASVAASATDTIVATSLLDGKTFGQALVTVIPAGSNPIAVAITPVAPTVAAGHTVQFRATVTGTTNTGVTWSVSGAAKGTLSSSGLYTAPASVAATLTDTVVATSQADGKTTGQVTVYVAPASARVTPMPIISRGRPAFASSGTASNGSSADYGSFWQSNGQPAWIAYDLSGVPVSQRKQVIAYWVAPGVDTYDMMVLNNKGYDLPGPYVIEANAAAGGASGAPTSNWVTLVDRSGVPQDYKSGQFSVDLTGYNWIRFRTTGDNARNLSSNCRVKFDVYDAHLGVTDDWIFFGDSISGMAWHNPVCFLTTKVSAAKPAFTPLTEGGGVAFLTSGVDNSSGGGYFILNRWLALFPGKFVVLAYGSNDCNGGAVWSDSKKATVYKNYKAMVQAIIAAGKTPIIGTTLWAANTMNQACLLKYNELLGVRPEDTSPPSGTVAGDFPQVVKGPDLYGTFKDHSEWLPDGLHPSNEAGMTQYQKAWADWALANIYP